jgi:hypothetical protein
VQSVHRFGDDLHHQLLDLLIGVEGIRPPAVLQRGRPRCRFRCWRRARSPTTSSSGQISERLSLSHADRAALPPTGSVAAASPADLTI